ncbi:MAG: hypothetical protein HFG75_08080 [Hungatella sp.]|nr:hypothetical protein [Hungatella sp.]
MYTYPWYHWITFFYLYCFFGWIFESTYVSLKKRRFVNRGFLRLPMLPLYGTGAVMMLWVSLPVRDHLILVYLSGVVAATALEYVTGYMMERLFKMRYWDYSNQRLQIGGYICLSSSIAWGFLTIFLTEVIHQPVARLVLSLPPVMEFSLLTAVSCFFLADTVQSTREALALGQALEAMTKMKSELEEMQLQLALLKAETSQRVEQLRGDLRSGARQRITVARRGMSLRTAELRAETRLKAAQFKTDLKDVSLRQAIRLREEAAALLSRETAGIRSPLEDRIRLLTERRQHLWESRQKLSAHMSAYRKSILRGNPSAASKKFGEALRELSERLEER